MYRLVIIFQILLSTNLIIGQNVNLNYLQHDYMTKFDRYTKESGLSNNKCLKIFQDRYGYIWIGTEDGLNRFDGHEFIQYFHSPNDSLSISGNFISDITEDIYGNLWIATHSGLNLFKRENESFLKLLKTDTKNSIRNNHVRAILADSLFLWIETLDGTLSKLDIKNNLFEHYKHQKISQEYYNYHDILKDKNGKIWLGGRNMGPCKFDPKSNIFTYYNPGNIDKGKKREYDVACYFIDHTNTFWVSATDGVYTFNDSLNTFRRVLATSTFSITEDKNQNLWLGTGNGVIQYNEKRKKSTLFLYDENNPNSISDNHINHVYEDNEGNIWIATNKGLNKLSTVKNKFGHIYHIPENKNSLSSNKVSTLTEDKNGNLWIGYENHGFDKFNLEDKTFKQYNKQEYKLLKSDKVSKLYFDSNNQLWIGLWQGVGFHKLNPETNQIFHYAYDPNTRKRDWYSDFLEDSENNFWVGFWGSHGLQLFNRKTGEFEEDHFKPQNKPLEQNITALVSDEENIWIGSSIGLIYQYNLKQKSFKAFANGNLPYSEFQKIRYKKLFPFRNVLQIINDQFNRKWFVTDKGFVLHNPLNNDFKTFPFTNNQSIQLINTDNNKTKSWITSNNQLFEFNFNNKQFRLLDFAIDRPLNIKYIFEQNHNYYIISDSSFYKTKNNSNVLTEIKRFKDQEIKNVFIDSKDQFWIFSNQKIMVYNTNLNNIEFDIINPEITDFDVFCLFNFDNSVWLGTNNGLFSIDQKNNIKHFHSDKTQSNQLLSDQVLSITSVNNILWIGTDKGLFTYDIEENLFSPNNQPESNSLTSHLVSVLFEDLDGNIWIGTTDKGLNKLNLKTNIIEHFTHNPLDSTSISNNNITCITQDSDKNIWVGTMDGLNLLSSESKQFIRLHTGHELAEKQIMSIVQDQQDQIWIGTKNGCLVYNPKTKLFKQYKQSDGLQSNQFTKAAFLLKNGEIVLGGEKGINIFNPSEIGFDYKEPNIQITGFKIFDKSLKTDFTTTQKIQLNYKDNFFTIRFSSLNFSNPSQYKYLYKLSGVDPDWVNNKNSFEAQYTDIKPGNYTFYVKSISPDGKESKTKNLQIFIAPPFWQTWWFYLLIIVLIFSISMWIILLRINKLKTEKENIQLEQKLLRSQMNPHFIFNALFSIQNFIYLKNLEKVNHFLTKFARLLRLILENSRVSQITIENEVQTITNYIDLQKLRFDDRFSYSIHVDPKIDIEEVTIPPMLAQPFIENAIEHGFVDKSKKYNLKISIELFDKNLVYTIEDNGIGINKSHKLKSPEEKKHKSLGMKITEKRLQNLKKISNQNIKVQVLDLSTEDKEGTRIKFTIPLIKTKRYD